MRLGCSGSLRGLCQDFARNLQKKRQRALKCMRRGSKDDHKTPCEALKSTQNEAKSSQSEAKSCPVQPKRSTRAFLCMFFVNFGGLAIFWACWDAQKGPKSSSRGRSCRPRGSQRRPREPPKASQRHLGGHFCTPKLDNIVLRGRSVARLAREPRSKRFSDDFRSVRPNAEP